MPHYICTGGCKGVSDTPGVCQAEDCPKHNHELQECDCTDGKHYGAFDKGGEEVETEPEQESEEIETEPKE